MDHEWIVEVRDDSGTPISTATKVALAPYQAIWDWPFETGSPAATHAHTGAGTYEATAPITPSAGCWLLVVLVDGKSPVTQFVEMKPGAPDEMVTAPTDFYSKPRTATAIAFSSEVKTVGAARVRRTRFVVTVFPSAEIVLLSGDEFESQGTQFRIFAENWAKSRHAQKKIDDGAIVTIFSCDDRARDRMVFAKDGGLSQVDSFAFGSTAGIVPGRDHPPVPPVDASPDVSIVTLYKYLDAVGKADPGRVKEVHIFTHSWIGGPILFNTTEDPAVRPMPRRDPNDFDARSKDFNTTNMTGWPDVSKALARNGRWHIWGCSATAEIHDLTAAAFRHKKDGDAAFFTVTTRVFNNAHTVVKKEIEQRTNRQRVRAYMDRQFRADSYLAVAAASVGVAVLGPPPGVGSSFGSDAFGRERMFVDMTANAAQFGFFKDEFKPEFEPTDDGVDTGYVDYGRVASRPPVPSVPFSSEFYYFERTLPANNLLVFANSRGVAMTGAHVTVEQASKPGFATPGMSGHLYVLRDARDPSKSQAFFVQEDEKTFRVDRDAAGHFTVLGPQL
jgi:hypothetical protein